MDLLLACILNVYKTDWGAKTWQEGFSNYLALTILCLFALILPSLAIYLTCNLDAFRYGEFTATYDAVLDGTRHESPRQVRVAITYTGIYILRRTVFALSCIFYADFLWHQLTVQILSCLMVASYVLQFSSL